MPPPRMTTSPRIEARPHPGDPVTAHPGHWDGADEITLQWCRDGRPIDGATGPAYVPSDEEDGALLSVMAIARKDGGRTVAESDPRRITCAAPRLLPVMLDDVFDVGTGLQEIPAGHAFRGRALRFSAEGGGASIDPRTGLLRIPTDRAHSGRDVMVVAQNSGGAESLVIRVTVEDDGAEDETGDLARTLRTDILVADGVSFQFAEPAETGHFMTGAAGAGDPFVVGPVTLLGYTPGPATLSDGRIVNGAMLNPPSTRRTGFDSLAPRDTYDPDLNAGHALPLRLEPGDSLIVATSILEREKGKSHIDRFVVLTCVADVPFADSFRPPYSGPERPIYRWSDVDMGRLARLPVIARRPPPDPDELARRFDRFAIDFVPNWNRGALSSGNHPPGYGRDLGLDQGAPLVWVNSDRPDEEKRPIVAGLVQRGIDRYGIFLSALAEGNSAWPPDGGHNHGRKVTIMFAGHLLDVDGMRHVVRRAGPDRAFQEDALTFEVTPEIVALSQGPDWKPSYGDERPQQPYELGMAGMPDWRGRSRPESASASWSSNPYRVAATHNSQHGQVLAILAMGLKEAWGHDPYFDYHIRYTEIMRGAPDPWRFRGGRTSLYEPVVGSRPEGGHPSWQLHWKDSWTYMMYDVYRLRIDPLPWEG